MVIENTIQSVIEKVSVFDKMYHQIRIVDPYGKKAYKIVDEEIIELDHACYNYWTHNQICQNCISMRAHENNDIYMKLEHAGNKVYLVSAVPVEVDHKKLVLELLKDITKNMDFVNLNKENLGQIVRVLKETNRAIMMDPLTNVSNRRFLMDRLPSDMVRHHMNNQPLVLIIVDLDDFKKLNDNYGHICGDDVLKSVAGVLKTIDTSNEYWVSRFGGEEFAIAVHNCAINEGIEIAEQIRENIEALDIVSEGQQIKVTASLGVSQMDTELDKDMDLFIARCDQLLYKAKADGKNRVHYRK